MNPEETKKITEYIFLESKTQNADLAFVFGTKRQEVFSKVYKLYKDKLVPKILLSGGKNRVTGENEAEEMSRRLINLGVKKEDIILEDRSANSLENVLFSKKVIEEKIGFNNIKKILVIAKHYHSRRALMTLKKHFPKNVILIPITYNVYGFTKDDWFKSEIGKEKVMAEWNKIPAYLEKNDIEEL